MRRLKAGRFISRCLDQLTQAFTAAPHQSPAEKRSIANWRSDARGDRARKKKTQNAAHEIENITSATRGSGWRAAET